MSGKIKWWDNCPVLADNKIDPDLWKKQSLINRFKDAMASKGMPVKKMYAQYRTFMPKHGYADTTETFVVVEVENGLFVHMVKWSISLVWYEYISTSRDNEFDYNNSEIADCIVFTLIDNDICFDKLAGEIFKSKCTQESMNI